MFPIVLVETSSALRALFYLVITLKFGCILGIWSDEKKNHFGGIIVLPVGRISSSLLYYLPEC